jgi:hypothetical protein
VVCVQITEAMEQTMEVRGIMSADKHGGSRHGEEPERR